MVSDHRKGLESVPSRDGAGNTKPVRCGCLPFPGFAACLLLLCLARSKSRKKGSRKPKRKSQIVPRKHTGCAVLVSLADALSLSVGTVPLEQQIAN